MRIFLTPVSFFLICTSCVFSPSSEKSNPKGNKQDWNYYLQKVAYTEKISLKNFHLDAFEAQSQIGSGTWFLNHVLARLEDWNVQDFSLTGENGVYDPQQRYLVLTNNIVAVLPELTVFFTDRVECWLDRQLILAPTHIQLKSQRLGRLTANSLEYHWDKQTMRFKGQVEMTLFIRDQEAYLKSRELFWDQNNQLALFEGDFHLVLSQWRALAQRGRLLFDALSRYPKIINLEGEVAIDFEKMQAVSNQMEFDVKEHKIKFLESVKIRYGDKIINSQHIDIDLNTGYVTLQQGVFEGF